VKKKVLFVGLFLALALALSVSAVGSAEPASSQGVVTLWAFYDKDVNAYPTGWTYLDPVITDPMDWQQDSPWLPFPSPHYALYGGTWGSDAMGALIQEGDFGPGVAEIPLADGLYWVVLSAPPGGWQLTTDAVQKVYVWNGNVYVQWASEGLWYGDKVLVGIVDGGCPAWLTIEVAGCGSGWQATVHGYGFTPGEGAVYYQWIRPGGSWIDSGYATVLPDGSLQIDLWVLDEGMYTLIARDLATGCAATQPVEFIPCD